MRPLKICKPHLITCIILLLASTTINTTIARIIECPLTFIRSSPPTPIIKDVINNDNTIILRKEEIPLSILKLKGGAQKRRTNSKSKSYSKSKLASSMASKVLQEPSKFEETMKKYQNILPATRLYITMVGISTLLLLILGEEQGQAILALDPIRTIYGLELWRPLTAASFLGKPSIPWLMSAYYLFEYGSSLERAFGTAQQFVFLFVQICLLTVISIFLGVPFFGQSVITAMLHTLSRSMPHQNVKWLIFNVPYWSLPYGLMASDVLQGGASAAVPHILGILSGHVYYFHKFLWPKLGGEDWLKAPTFIAKRLDPDYGGGTSEAKKSLDKALKKRKKGKGRKLGA